MRSYSDEGLGLAVAVDTAVEQPVSELSIHQLQTHITALCSQTERRHGRISQAIGELHSRSGDQVRPTAVGPAAPTPRSTPAPPGCATPPPWADPPPAP